MFIIKMLKALIKIIEIKTLIELLKIKTLNKNVDEIFTI